MTCEMLFYYGNRLQLKNTGQIDKFEPILTLLQSHRHWSMTVVNLFSFSSLVIPFFDLADNFDISMIIA